MNYSWIKKLLTGPAGCSRPMAQLPVRVFDGFVCRAICGVRPRMRKLGMTLALSASVLSSGCLHTEKTQVQDLHYADDIEGLRHYRDYSSAIEHPCLDNVTPLEVQTSDEPRNLHRRADDSVRDITLSEMIYHSLSHNQIIESSALGPVASKTVLVQPQAVTSVYDPAIQETGVLFGRRGLNSALADFDATFSTSMVWGRNSTRINVPGAPLATAETGTFRSGINKSFATGGSVSLSHNWNYLGTNSSTALFPSTYNGSVGASLRQPLLAGGGVEFSRIAGPINPAFGSITGVSQGVVIARINQDVTLADFEIAVRNAVRDIENTYWDLYLTYRVYDTAVIAHQSAFQTWREAQTRFEVGTLKAADELQARDRLYETKAQVETALNALYKSESELRRLVGMPMNDGDVLRPTDEPMFAEFVPDWKGNLAEALSQRTELRRQKWQVKSLQLQLTAAQNLVQPRLDALASYDVNGFGNRLLSQGVTDPGTGLPVNSGFGSMSRDNLESWTVGFQFSMPVGFRQARSQVRNYELQVAKANAVLAQQERNIAHDIAMAIQDITASYDAAQSNAKRLRAAARRVELLQAEREIGTTTLDLVLRAQASVAAAESSLYLQVVNYNKAITSLHVATGSLLRENGVFLEEGPWTAEAMCDAALRSQARTHGHPNGHLSTEPCEFASPGFAGNIELQTPSSKEERTEPPPAPAPEAVEGRAYDE
jgi:outer membrane protein TolC